MSAHDDPQAPARENAKAGIAWMLFTMFMFVSMDACAKYMVQTHDTMQVMWGRYFFHFVLLGLVLSPKLRDVVVTQNIRLQLIRSVLLLLTTGLFFTGLRYVPLADASSIMLASPIVVTALSMPILKEKVGLRRWVSVIVGCIGALIIIRPGTGMMQAAALFPLGAAILYAFYQVSTRFLSHSDGVLTTLFYSASIGAVITTIMVPFFWEPLELHQWGLMALLGIFGGLGHFALIKAFTHAPAATVVPFTYTNLVWATSYGFLVFGDLPDLWTITGASIIVSSGLYIYHREQVRRSDTD